MPGTPASKDENFCNKNPSKTIWKTIYYLFYYSLPKKKIRQIYVSWKENYIELTYCNNYFWSYHLKL